MGWFTGWSEETLMGMFSAWASGKKAKIKNGSDWQDATPDNVKVKTLDGGWVSLREAIAAYDRHQSTDEYDDPDEVEDTQGDAPEWTQ